MPAKKIVNRDKILSCALDIVRESGMDALSVRALADRCKCSTQPIYLSFSGTEELKAELLKLICDMFDKRIELEISKGEYPEYKAVGMGYIFFAKEEKELFKCLLMRRRSGETDEEHMSFDRSTSLIMRNYALNRDAASKLHAEMWIFVHGIASMIVTGYLDWDDQTISEMLTDVFTGITKK